MAVDTRTKRYSIMDLGSHSLVLPDPTGTYDAKERLLSLDLYSGILVPDEGGGPPPPDTSFYWFFYGDE